MNIVAVDQDSGDDSSFIVTLLGVGNGGIYFLIHSETVTARRKRSTYTQFSLRLAQKISLTYDKNFTFTIKVSDSEAPEQYFGVPVEARYTADPPSGPEPATAVCLTCTNNGKYLVALMAIEGVILFALLTHICIHCCCSKSEDKVNNIQLIPMAMNRKFAMPKHKRGGRLSISSVDSTSDRASKSVSSSQVGVMTINSDATPVSRHSKPRRSTHSSVNGLSLTTRHVVTNSNIKTIIENISSSSSSDDGSDSSGDDHMTQGATAPSHYRFSMPSHARASSPTTGLPSAVHASSVYASSVNMYPKGF